MIQLIVFLANYIGRISTQTFQPIHVTLQKKKKTETNIFSRKIFERLQKYPDLVEDKNILIGENNSDR